ncbi:MAG: SusE domain-containing protein [Flavobacteriaceae bacterium]
MRISNKLLYILGFIGLGACSPDEELTVMDPEVSFDLYSSQDKVVLDKDFSEDIALTLSWLKPDYGYESPNANFEINIEGYTMSTTRSYSYSPLVEEMNLAIIENELAQPGVATELEMSVVANQGANQTVSSVIIEFTPYAIDPVWITSWGIAGTQTDWDNNPDLHLFKTEDPSTLVSYVTFDKGDNQYKFRENNDWTNQWGSDGNGGLSNDGGSGNIGIADGMYRITLNPDAGEYSQQEADSPWGLVGDAVNNWGETPDAPMYISENPDILVAYTYMTMGEFKFRMNNSYEDGDYGRGDSEGTLKPGGGNIKIPYDSWYKVTWNTIDNTYTLQAFQ